MNVKDTQGALRHTGWAGMSLAGQFAITGGVVVLVAALVVGSFVANRIEEVVVRNTANATALYMESLIAPITQDFVEAESLSSRNRKEISTLLAETELGKRVASYKVWRPGGLVVDASDTTLIGVQFEVTENLKQAWNGEVRADFDDTSDAEDAGEDALDVPLLEIYSPIRNRSTGEVVSVIEFYEIADTLQRDIAQARATSWAAVVGVLALLGAAMYLIVLRGSKTIDAQIVALREMSSRNLSLRLQMQEASGRAAAMSERALRQIGADLHDGPAQLMAFAALRLDAVRRAAGDDRARADVDEVAGAVGEAIGEIRNISRGLSVPDLDQRDMGRVVQGLADAHAARTGTAVDMSEMQADLPDLPAAVRLAVFRFVQEGLNNAWRHARGRGQKLRLGVDEGRMVLSVLDQGPGFGAAGWDPAQSQGRLGLMGLKNRIEAIGGRLDVLNRPDPPGGAELRMTIELGAQP